MINGRLHCLYSLLAIHLLKKKVVVEEEAVTSKCKTALWYHNSLVEISALHDKDAAYCMRFGARYTYVLELSGYFVQNKKHTR